MLKASFPTECEQEDSGNQSVKVSSAMGKWLNRQMHPVLA